MDSVFNLQDYKILEQISVSTLLDLALILPCSLEDYSLDKQIQYTHACATEIKILKQKTTTKFLLLEVFSKTWQIYFNVLIFHAKPWHYSVFKKDKEMLIYGKLLNFANNLSMCNPKIVKESGYIRAYYKLSLSDEEINLLKTKYLTRANLKKYVLNDDEIDTILSLNKNDRNRIFLFENLKNNPKILHHLKFLEIYNYLRKLNSKKTQFQTLAFQPYDISKWINSLPFKPTNDQLNAFNDISNDLKSSIAKKRVIMGDVGSGKSLVMFATALMCKDKKSIIMAPTSILAQQLFDEALKFLPKNFKIILITSKIKCENLYQADLIIGTHALLYQELPNVVAVMIDEQHRFGSNQRAKIEHLGSSNESRAHVFQFSATPIPRTLALINSSFVNYSFLKQLPFKKDICTSIIKDDDFSALLHHIKEQILLKKQIVIVYPLVEDTQNIKYASLKSAAAFWQKNFDNVYVTYGKDKQKDEIVANFAQNGNILLSTTIIEVGISLPRLDTIIIVGAERLGLASLHQLRGRVGRYASKGWCFLYTKLKEIPQRLLEFSKTLDGFEIANIDYKNRQAGDILDGKIQHGMTFNFYNMEENIASIAQKRLQNLQ